tara:strand:- start:400 stop:1419 length:1020 start_codon:yes stop_codon:yes gene_type:complete
MKKVALITGILGQDGAYLANFLISKNYKIIGTSRNMSKSKIWRLKKLKIENKIKFIKLDICKINEIKKIIRKHKIDEIYNFAAQSYVSKSFQSPVQTASVNALGVIKILEVIRNVNSKIKFYQASSSEMFGNTKEKSNKNYDNFNPRSPYAISKLFGHGITKMYRNSYNLYAVSGILFNHDSPLRSEDFVTKKIVVGMIKILKRKKKFLELGNINTKRDWGYAKEFVPHIWRMMQLKKPEDFIIATGKSHSIKEFINMVTIYLNIDTKWVGKGINERLVNKRNNQIIIKINKKLFRPSEINYSRGIINKASKNLNWKPKTTLKKLVKIMVEDEMINYST